MPRSSSTKNADKARDPSYAKGLAQAEDVRLVVVHVDEFHVGRGGSYSVLVNEDEIQAAIRKQVDDLRAWSASLEPSVAQMITLNIASSISSARGWRSAIDAT